MNKVTKLTIITILLATTALMLAFLLKKPDDITTENSEENKLKLVKLPSDPESVDHTITADMHIHKDANKAPIIKVTKDGIESESEKWGTLFFKNYLDETLKLLPNLEQTKNLKDGDIHHAPAFLMEAGLRLGKIKRQVKLNKDFAAQAMVFYTECASKKDGFTPIRGLCLANLIYMKKRLAEPLDISSYPKKVTDLAKKALEFTF